MDEITADTATATLEADPYETALAQLDATAERLGLDDAMRQYLRTNRRELTVNLAVRMDDGSTAIVWGCRVQHNNARGPCKGGLRFHPDVHLNEVRALAMWMTWKCAIPNIPYGGGKGGVKVDYKSLSPTELREPEPRLRFGHRPDHRSRPGCARARRGHRPAGHGLDRGHLQPRAGGLEPGGSDRQAGQRLRHLGQRRRHRPRHPVRRRGGSPLPRLARWTGRRWPSRASATPGSGRPACWRTEGCRVVAVSDTSGGIYNGQGLDVEAAVAHKLAERQDRHLQGRRPHHQR